MLAVAVALSVLTTPLPDGWTNARVVIDAGHGAANNSGTVDAFCQPEQTHTKFSQDAWRRGCDNNRAWMLRWVGPVMNRCRIATG